MSRSCVRQRPFLTTNLLSRLTFRPFQPEDQVAAHAIVMSGMAQRWGAVDPTLNPDLHDIAHSYTASGNYFFVGEVDGAMVATAALTLDADGVPRIERMSVRAAWQGMGFGRTFTHFLIDQARELGHAQLRVETNSDWTSALKLYQSCGFVLESTVDGPFGQESNLVLDLTLR